MARINIDDTWFFDPRREKLAKLIGDELIADGAIIRLWRLAQDYWKQNFELIPNHVFEHVRYCSEIVQCGLVSVRNEGVYVRGSSKQFEWINKQKENASRAGKKSAEKRRLIYGSAQPKSRNSRTIPEQSFEQISNSSEQHRTKTNEIEPSISSSSSSSFSISSSKSKKTIVGIRLDYPPEFDALWQAYGRRGDKKAAYEIYRGLQLTSDEFVQLQIAVKNYAQEQPDLKYRKHLDRFLKSDWREKIKTVPQNFVPVRRSIEEILKDEGK